MKFIAVLLLMLCLYDTIDPIIEVNKVRIEVGYSWIEALKKGKMASTKYLFSIFVNVIAIIFFTIYLMP